MVLVKKAFGLENLVFKYRKKKRNTCIKSAKHFHFAFCEFFSARIFKRMWKSNALDQIQAKKIGPFQGSSIEN